MQKLTMIDIAKDLGVSKTTVSRAISGKGRIGKETREKIMNYIESKGYSPNNIARGLAGSKTYNIGVIIPDSRDGGDAPFFKAALVGITETAVKRDYDTVLAVVSDEDISSLKRLVVNRKVDGIVHTRPDSSDRVIPFLQTGGIPFVLIGSDKRSQVCQIDSNQKDACREIVKHVMSGGAKKIALLAGPKGHVVENLRFQGYSAAFAELGQKVDDSLVYWNCLSEIEAIVSDVLDKKADCIACADDIICSKVMGILKKKKVSVPSKIQVISFFDSDILQKNEIPVSAVHVDIRALSNRAGDLLLDIIDGLKPQTRNLVDCSVIYRSSSR